MTLENGYLLKGRYRILDILGQGQVGVVYRAVDEKLDLSVVIKEIQYVSADTLQRFDEEARFFASLRHPNLSRVHDFFVIEGQAHYLVKDYVEGGDLLQWMARADGLTEMEVLQIGIAVCDALIYLHTHEPPITHGGVKPENIKFTPHGEVILVDLGFTKTWQDHQAVMGEQPPRTSGISPPEQYGQGSIDHRLDIFSLGASLYTALAGYPPEDSLDRATGKVQLSPLKSYQPYLSQQTAQAIEKALRIRLEDRWQSAQAFKDALIQARDALPTDMQKNSRITSLSRIAADDSANRRATPSDREKLALSKFKRFVQDYLSDPVWYFFGSVILLVVVFLVAILIRPQLLRGIFLEREPAVLPQVMAENPTSTANLPVATQVAEITQPPQPRSTRAATLPALGYLPTPPSPTPTGGGGLIAYVSEQSGNPQIWLVNVTSMALTQLTDLNDGACQPDWSPSGEQIVFTSPCTAKRKSYPGSRLVIIDVDSREMKTLTASLEGDYDPAWSPDGEWIAYTTLINGRSQLAKINLQDKTPIRLSDGRSPDFSPAWSPDGTQLAFVRDRGIPQIWLMDADGENQTQFTWYGEIENSNPAWYNDGNMILFSQSLGIGSPSKQLYGMRLEDIGQPQEYSIIPRMRLDYIPLMDNVAVSPDGYWLAFDYWYFDVLSDIYIMNFPGANLIQLTDHPGLDYSPAWSPRP